MKNSVSASWHVDVLVEQTVLQTTLFPMHMLFILCIRI